MGMAVARGAQLGAIVRHVLGARVPGVAQGEPGDALARRDDRAIGRIGVGVMDGDGAGVVQPKLAIAADHHLVLVGAVEMRLGDAARPLFDQKRHRVQRVLGRDRLVRFDGVAVGADKGGVPAIGGLAPVGLAHGLGVRGQDHGQILVWYCRLRVAAGSRAVKRGSALPHQLPAHGGLGVDLRGRQCRCAAGRCRIAVVLR